MSHSRWVADTHAGMIVALVLVGARAAWDTRVNGVVWDVFRGDLR